MSTPMVRCLFGATLALTMAVALMILPLPRSVGAAPTFTVNSAGDVVASAPLTNGVCETAPGNGVCTLRAAIMKANHYPGGGVQINLPAGIYTLTLPASGSDDETTGDLNITNTLTLVGIGASSTIIDGDGSVTDDRVLSIDGAITATISGVTIRNGHCGSSCWDYTHTGLSAGGGIYFHLATLALSNSTLIHNIASNYAGGAIYIDNGTLLLTQSTVMSNTAWDSGGIRNQIGIMTLTQSIVISNTSNHAGGGIRNTWGGVATLVDVTLSGNSALNTGAWDQVGGGIWNEQGGTATLINSTLSGNSANGNGGGIANGGLLTVINSTLSGNSAAGSGGGIDNAQSGTTNLYNATITKNKADANFDGSGIGGGVNNYTGTLNFQNSLLAENTETAYICFMGCGYVSSAGDCAGPVNAQGYNILYNYDTTRCKPSGSFTLADPKLGPLANDGGATQTHALLAGSPAIDAIPFGTNGCGIFITTDQRGFHRPAFGGSALRCDIGAVEYYAHALRLPLIVK